MVQEFLETPSIDQWAIGLSALAIVVSASSLWYVRMQAKATKAIQEAESAERDRREQQRVFSFEWEEHPHPDCSRLVVANRSSRRLDTVLIMFGDAHEPEMWAVGLPKADGNLYYKSFLPGTRKSAVVRWRPSEPIFAQTVLLVYVREAGKHGRQWRKWREAFTIDLPPHLDRVVEG